MHKLPRFHLNLLTARVARLDHAVIARVKVIPNHQTTPPDGQTVAFWVSVWVSFTPY